MRPVVVHYHYFKNAGTSVDEILSKNFGSRWVTAEFQGMNNHDAVGKWILDNPDASAFSSHTAQFPLPELDNVKILPIVFLRHPLDRILSAYSFERTQISDNFGAKLAKSTDLAGYIRVRLDAPHDTQCRNFQTFRMAKLLPGPKVSEMDRALDALRRLPFVGLVEDFAASAMRMETWLKTYYPDFKAFTARKNVSASKNLSLDQRLVQMRRDIGETLYAELVDANLKDLCLHHAAKVRTTELEQAPAPEGAVQSA
ncbi:MAG: sulfotransferase family 2 domain-containing protein [Alphaproteobacteria bacterium]|nr:sulfotransferase family 2 domain-containing protein [Alphaproteobacteria bacterium]